ncbi:unnamed protein product [Trichobilharzia szidati]|nr:unnamed protein product [Trichobilharzia szidati]
MLAILAFMVLVISLQVESVSFDDLKEQVRSLVSKVVNVGPISCYTCIGCEKVDSSTPKKSNCPACIKAVLTTPFRHVSRGCTPSCKELPRQQGLELNCCESELCNSTSQIKSNLKLICFTLLVFITTKSIYKV